MGRNRKARNPDSREHDEEMRYNEKKTWRWKEGTCKVQGFIKMSRLSISPGSLNILVNETAIGGGNRTLPGEACVCATGSITEEGNLPPTSHRGMDWIPL